MFGGIVRDTVAHPFGGRFLPPLGRDKRSCHQVGVFMKKPPHLLETYEGIVHKRTMANGNNDKFPDYYEFQFIEDSLKIRIKDSIPFYWSQRRNLYITNVNPRWFRKY